MSDYETYILIATVVGVMMLLYIAKALENSNKHYSNIANRLLDIEILLRDRR